MLYYLFLVVGWSVLLFYLSSMSYSEQDIKPYLKLLLKEEYIHQFLSPLEIPYRSQTISVEQSGAYGFVEFLIRKWAHLFFYSVLGYNLVRYFASIPGKNYLRIFLLSMMALAAISMLDEFLQHLNPERSGQWADVWLNCAGGVKGVIGGLFSTYKRNKRHKYIQKSVDPTI
jgi:VanZ family protein